MSGTHQKSSNDTKGDESQKDEVGVGSKGGDDNLSGKSGDQSNDDGEGPSSDLIVYSIQVHRVMLPFGRFDETILPDHHPGVNKKM